MKTFEKNEICPRSGLLKSFFCSGSPGAKNTSIRTSVRVGGAAAKTCAQGGCFGGKVPKELFRRSSALGRVLLISREIYSAVKNGESELNQTALLDSLAGDEKKPLSKCMRAFKAEIKRAGKPFYQRVKPLFSPLVPVPEFDFDLALRHIPAMIYGNDQICRKLIDREDEKARSMADAMGNYPGFLSGEFEALTGTQFYDLVFGYYPKLYGEPFMDEMKYLFE